ncbi:MAG: hypothetical protein LBI72_06125 [Flavobacteriaceae bacterium]|jgi:hypothetical protein|nr:hypothetical protein [Flavobacteriaceae bacterium]
MGWFTNQNKLWEIKETVLFLGSVGVVSFLSLGLLTPVLIFLLGRHVKLTRWNRVALFLGVVYFFVLLLAFMVLLSGSNPFLILLGSFISFYIYVVYMALSLPEYFQRLDLKNYIYLEDDKVYDYYSVVTQVESLKSTVSTVEIFLKDLRSFSQQIENKNVVKEIEEIARLVQIIEINHVGLTEQLLERHVITLSNALLQYVNLTQRYHKTIEVEKSISRLEELISYARIAFENELTQLIEKEVLEVDSESSVYLSVLRSRGFV